MIQGVYLRLRRTAQLLALAAICLPASAAAQSSIQVVGLDGQHHDISFDSLSRVSVATADAAGIKTTHEGVALRDVLIKAGVPMGAALRGKALAQVVLATAADGYQVAYAIAELDPEFNDQVIVIADRRNGQPLLPDSGPLQIIVPQDKRAARWVRQVKTLEVRQLP
jgi:hypothetical protein